MVSYIGCTAGLEMFEGGPGSPLFPHQAEGRPYAGQGVLVGAEVILLAREIHHKVIRRIFSHALFLLSCYICQN